MKVLITEEQLQSIKEIYALNEFIGPINESIDLYAIWDKYKQAILAGVASAAIMASIANLNIDSGKKITLSNLAQQELANLRQGHGDVNEPVTADTFNEKVDAVREYMEKAIKNQGFNPNNLQLSPEEMVKACEETGFDLPLLMAQAHLESCFGFGKRARQTGSVFSVGCYDNGKNMATYSDQNQSIRPYIRLMQRDYFGDNKTVDDILSPNSLVNMNGHRYAQDKNYENKVKSIRNKIIKQYPILNS